MDLLNNGIHRGGGLCKRNWAMLKGCFKKQAGRGRHRKREKSERREKERRENERKERERMREKRGRE